MGADLHLKIELTPIQVKKLEKEAEKVPIDFDYENGKANFHYGYWGSEHALECELFVSEWARKNNIKSKLRWSY